jgi:hypothetical protein
MTEAHPRQRPDLGGGDDPPGLLSSEYRELFRRSLKLIICFVSGASLRFSHTSTRCGV